MINVFQFLLSKNNRTAFSLLKRYFQSTASTIYALSTNIKNSGSPIAVIRVSGPRTLNVIEKLTNGRTRHYENNPRKAFKQSLFDPNNFELIDQGMVLWFPKPSSYSGEDMCEFHVHGSVAVITRMLAVLGQINQCRLANEGEFTKRALLNQKLQLVQVEGIKDLIQAKTDQQRRRALNVMGGSVDKKFNIWREKIIKMMAHLEAFIDFSEEELLDENVLNNFKQEITKVQIEIEQYLFQTKSKSQLIKDGIQVAIVGEANVGKSSLLNKLCDKDVSIISSLSGTTRDIVESWMDINGYCVCLADTAGIKDLAKLNNEIDYVEQQGIKKALQRAKECHLIILVIDAEKLFKNDRFDMPEYLRKIVTEKNSEQLLMVINKIDLLNENERHEMMQKLETNIDQNFFNKTNIICMSCLNNQGFSNFFDAFKTKIEKPFEKSNFHETGFSNERHITHLEQILDKLGNSIKTYEVDLAISASYLRQAIYHLGCLTGKIFVDDVLDIIFKDFCIGK